MKLERYIKEYASAIEYRQSGLITADEAVRLILEAQTQSKPGRMAIISGKASGAGQVPALFLRLKGKCINIRFHT